MAPPPAQNTSTLAPAGPAFARPHTMATPSGRGPDEAAVPTPTGPVPAQAQAPLAPSPATPANDAATPELGVAGWLARVTGRGAAPATATPGPSAARFSAGWTGLRLPFRVRDGEHWCGADRTRPPVALSHDTLSLTPHRNPGRATASAGRPTRSSSSRKRYGRVKRRTGKGAHHTSRSDPHPLHPSLFLLLSVNGPNPAPPRTARPAGEVLYPPPACLSISSSSAWLPTTPPPPWPPSTARPRVGGAARAGRRRLRRPGRPRTVRPTRRRCRLACFTAGRRTVRPRPRRRPPFVSRTASPSLRCGGRPRTRPWRPLCLRQRRRPHTPGWRVVGRAPPPPRPRGPPRRARPSSLLCSRARAVVVLSRPRRATPRPPRPARCTGCACTRPTSCARRRRPREEEEEVETLSPPPPPPASPPRRAASAS